MTRAIGEESSHREENRANVRWKTPNVSCVLKLRLIGGCADGGRYTCHSCLEQWTQKNPDNLRCSLCQRDRGVVTRKERLMLKLTNAIPAVKHLEYDQVDAFLDLISTE